MHVGRWGRRWSRRRGCGAKSVFRTDIHASRWSWPPGAGADHALSGESEEVTRKILEKTGGLGVTAVIDTVGSAETFARALRMLAPTGTLVNMATSCQAGDVQAAGDRVGAGRRQLVELFLP